MKATEKSSEPVLSKVLLTPEEVIALIPGLKVKLLAEWRYRKEGPRYYKVGRIILYPFDDLEAWFEGLAAGGEESDG